MLRPAPPTDLSAGNGNQSSGATGTTPKWCGAVRTTHQPEHRQRQPAQWCHWHHFEVLRPAPLTDLSAGNGNQSSGATGTTPKWCGPHHSPT
ncbi:hypothetical protein [Pseudomonas huaxiensis]|uniref:hypothetical protein n=1 Tax=Pseudomonas huaxiensis TaxID=2213017 RepID=UPI001300B329|nr:hypothetical protein [Pseudomonas huaxiensis]